MSEANQCGSVDCERVDMQKIESHDVTLKAFGQYAGDAYEVVCPECRGTVTVANEFGWWDTKCFCGYTWEVHVYATGEKE